MKRRGGPRLAVRPLQYRRVGPPVSRGFPMTTTTASNTLPWPMLSAIIRARGLCAHCGGRFDPSDLHADHIVPRRAGGPDTLANLQPLCRACHGVKTVAENRVYGQAPSLFASLIKPTPATTTGRYAGLEHRAVIKNS